jgi:hypothetical protein
LVVVVVVDTTVVRESTLQAQAAPVAAVQETGQLTEPPLVKQHLERQTPVAAVAVQVVLVPTETHQQLLTQRAVTADQVWSSFSTP